jgi:chromosome segregation ATPase
VTSDQIAVWVRERSLDPETEKALQSIVAKKNEVSAIAKQIETLGNEQSQIFSDQERIRSNVQRLGQTPEEATLRQRYIKQLNEQENRLDTIKTERQKLETARSNAQKQLDDLIQNLSFDKKME